MVLPPVLTLYITTGVVEAGGFVVELDTVTTTSSEAVAPALSFTVNRKV
jgi:hypothetical protein